MWRIRKFSTLLYAYYITNKTLKDLIYHYSIIKVHAKQLSFRLRQLAADSYPSPWWVISVDFQLLVFTC
jgi:hypothetical protein